jgi:hypothetical protein
VSEFCYHLRFAWRLWRGSQFLTFREAWAHPYGGLWHKNDPVAEADYELQCMRWSRHF